MSPVLSVVFIKQWVTTVTALLVMPLSIPHVFDDNYHVLCLGQLDTLSTIFLF